MRTALALASLLALGGCALAAGYDFGSYKERTSGGGGGGATSAGGGGDGGVGGSTSTLSSSSGGGGAGGAASGGGGATSAGGAGGAGGSGPLILYSGPDPITGLALDDTTVFFTTSDGASIDGKLIRVEKDGTGTTTLVTGELAPASLSLDGTHAYWSSNGTTNPSTIKRALKSVAGPSQPLVKAKDFVSSVALFGGNMFWTGSDENIWKSLPNGTLRSKIEQTLNGSVLVTADADGIYWCEVGTNNGDGSVLQADTTGQNVVPIAINQPHEFSIITDMNRVYWGTTGVFSTPKGGGKKFTNFAVSKNNVPVGGLAVDTTDIYFSNGPSIYRVAIMGKNPTPIASEDITADTNYVAVDATYVYYTVYDSNNARVVRVHK